MSDEEEAPPEAPAPGADAASEPPAPPAEPTPASEPSRIAQIVGRWVNEHLYNSPVSRDVESVNHLRSVIPALIAELERKD